MSSCATTTICEANDEIVTENSKTICEANDEIVTENSKTICEANDEIVTANSKTICEANDEFVTENSKTICEANDKLSQKLVRRAFQPQLQHHLLSHPELQPIFERMLEQMKAQVPKRLKHLSHMQTTDYDSEECTSTDEEDFSDDYLDAFSESESSTDEESEEESSENEKPSTNCQGYFAKKSLWRHQKKCTLKKAKENPTTSRTAQCQKAGRALLPTKSPCSAKLQEILAGMRTDSVVVTIRADSWICKLGEHHCDDSSTINHNIVSERMRRIARLLLETQQINASIKSAKDLVDPAHFDDVILGVNICSGFDTSNQNFEAPTLAKKLGQSLTTLAEIVIAESIKSSDTLQECKAEQFLKLKNLQWKQRIATKVYKQQCKQKWQKPKKVPLTADTVKLNQLLTNQVCTTKEKLQGNEVSTSTWRDWLL
ncbi:hypothetical protein BSL78_18941 [Apostichopus japonicus]|uniref:Uncharacterized protein n=1 Tax=Stichopus japonicus TaxID=307972 RepID=A0A2G8K8B9_STIJA|nr:hypothetical protein BSL78_18941 [Apostichopus japonicus]